MKKTTSIFLAVSLFFCLCACGKTSQELSAEPDGVKTQTMSVDKDQDTILEFTDDLGRTVKVKSAERVASMIGSFTDVWCLAGGKDSLVAAANDSWTSFDLDLDESIANIGPVKSPNLEVLMAAQPDFVICSSNTAADVELQDTFDKAGMTAAYFDVENFEDYLRMMDICTQITGCRENYKLYGEEIAAEIEEARSLQDGSHPSVLYVRASGSSCTVKSSSGNLLGEMLADLGCVNIADGDKAILENLSLEKIMEADPQFIFAVLQGADSTDAEKMLESTLLSNPAWKTLTAVKEGRFIILENSLYNLKPNAKWGYAYEKLAGILYGEDVLYG